MTGLGLNRGVILSLLGSLTLASGGCDDPERSERADGEMDEGADTMATVELDGDEIVAQAGNFATDLVKLSDGPEFEETHADAAAVQVWGSPDIAGLFASIDADDPTQNIEFPVGTLLVKEHLDEAGATRGMSVMYKAEPGYAPEAGDWFWARVDGDVTTDAGPVQWCSSCHAAAINSDFVVGFGKSP